MTKESKTKTIWIVLAIILGILIIGGLIAGFTLYSLYKIGTAAETSTSSSAAGVQDVTNYANARYGFSFSYPRTLTKTESQNGDGVTLTTNNPPMTIRVYGSMNNPSQNLDEYLNESRNNLFQEQSNGEEILSKDVSLGGISAQERQWKYTNSADGSETLMDQVTALKGDTFYTVQMVASFSAYNGYPVTVFDEVLQTYKFSG